MALRPQSCGDIEEMSLEDPRVPLRLEPVPLWALVQGCGAAPHPLSCPCLPISPQSTGVQQAEDVDGLLLGMSSQIAEREDNILVEDLQGLCSPKPQLAHFFGGEPSILGPCGGQGREAGPILLSAPNFLLQPASALLTEVQRSHRVCEACPWGHPHKGMEVFSMFSKAHGRATRPARHPEQLGLPFQLFLTITVALVQPADYWYGPLKYSRTDFMASWLQRGRDLGLPTYNQARERFGLQPLQDWMDLAPHLEQEVTGKWPGMENVHVGASWGSPRGSWPLQQCVERDVSAHPAPAHSCALGAAALG